MGLRSWLTPTTRENLATLIDAINANTAAYGASYVVELTKDVRGLGKAGVIIVAWSGDGRGSLEDMPRPLVTKTRLLDDFLSRFPAWHRGRGPEEYGVFIDREGEPVTRGKPVTLKKGT
jgi:hypothetical protein